MSGLFDFDLRPMQRRAADIPLGDGPVLAVIEDETGAGKTEAALLLAQRMLLTGKGREIYFALPTIATADAMSSRTAAVWAGSQGLWRARPSSTLRRLSGFVLSDSGEGIAKP